MAGGLGETEVEVNDRAQ